ncbi:hypothetical protein [Exilibacterium tricleocarpae]|uniref:hypothetical protein n=1 Tax=Exilibacterium tricleocarpae TaxID=2591008 RepID=UPI001FE99BDC|nr:hypothetical protein [Exilibacterium tricleocarpae]
MTTDAEGSTLDYFDFLNLVDRLYPEAAGAGIDANSDRQRLIGWAAAVNLFQTCSISDGVPSAITDLEPGDDLWQNSTYQHLLALVSRRYSSAPDPQEARYRFDYGREYRYRTAIREDLRKLFRLIENFYRLNARLLTTTPVESPATAPGGATASQKLPKPPTVEPVPISIQSEASPSIPKTEPDDSISEQQTPHSPSALAGSQKLLTTGSGNFAPDQVEVEAFKAQNKEKAVEYTGVKNGVDDMEQAVDALLHDLFIDE